MLNGFQQKVAGIAILCLSICAIGGFAIAVFKILGAFLDKFGAVIWPLALAVILSFILKPAVDFMADRLRVGRTAACWIMMAFLVVVITGGAGGGFAGVHIGDMRVCGVAARFVFEGVGAHGGAFSPVKGYNRRKNRRVKGYCAKKSFFGDGFRIYGQFF